MIKIFQENYNKMNKITKYLYSIIFSLLAMVNVACDDGKSYADLLADETKAVNNFLADQIVIKDIPTDSVFETGENAPYYKMDSEGTVYMQVLKAGTPENKAQDNQLIYFRFMRYNLNYYTNGVLPTGEGNADDMEYSPTSFRFGNYTLTSSSQYGSGIQLPLYYLGIDCEVNIVIKSQYGFSDEISNVIPYLYNIRYFKSQI